MRVQDSGEGERRPRSDAPLQEFFGRGEVFVRQLIAENERLRGELNGTTSDRGDSPESGVATLMERLMSRVAELERECQEARETAAKANAAAAAASASAAAAASAAGATETSAGGHEGDPIFPPSSMVHDLAGLPQRVEQLEHENYHLASMYVAGLQFHSARTLPEVLQTITEILLNFVGIGAFTLFVVDEERQVLFALAREGGDLESCSEVGVNDSGVSVGPTGNGSVAVASTTAGPQVGPQVGAHTGAPANGSSGGSGPHGSATGPIAAMIQRARPWTRGDPAYADDNAIMYLPLVSNRRLVAVLRLESFLAQKPGFDDNDFSLLSMISEHAGIAIETAWIRAHAKAVALQRHAVEQLVGA